MFIVFIFLHNVSEYSTIEFCYFCDNRKKWRSFSIWKKKSLLKENWKNDAGNASVPSGEAQQLMTLTMFDAMALEPQVLLTPEISG